MGGRPLVAVTFPLWKATIQLEVFELSPGVYLSFERTALQGTGKDAIWVYSFLANGLWVESADELHLVFDAMPHECMRMRVCSDLGARLSRLVRPRGCELPHGGVHGDLLVS